MSGARSPEIPASVAGALVARMSRGHEAIAVGSRAGVVEWTNSAWGRVTGWPLEEVVDKPVGHWLDRVGVEPAVLEFVQSHYAAGRHCAVELSIEGADGRVRAIHLDVEPVSDETGEVTHFVAVATDLGGRAEAAAAHGGPATDGGAAWRVHGPVATSGAGAGETRRLAILESFAAEALRMAREVERTCAEIERTTGVGLLDELGVRSVRERAERASDAARDLIQRAAEGPPPCRAVDLTGCVRRCVDAVRPALPARVQLDVLLDHDLPLAWGPPELVVEAIEALVSAAVDAVEDSWGTVSVTSGLTEPGRPLVSAVYHTSFAGTLHDDVPRCFVEVHDTGTSIPPEVWRRRALGVLAADASDRAAGLAELRARLGASRVDLHVHSTPGCGTRVLLLLPLAQA